MECIVCKIRQKKEVISVPVKMGKDVIIKYDVPYKDVNATPTGNLRTGGKISSHGYP
jgi:hypothetical protein